MHVAFIHPFMFRYRRGIERFIGSLSNALSQQDVEVSILTWKDKNDYQLDALDPSIHVCASGPFRYFAAQQTIPFYISNLMKNNYDLVNICFACYGEAESLFLASRLKKLRYNISFLYPFQAVPHRYHQFKRLGCLQRAERIFSLTGFVRSGVYDFCQRTSQVITGGVDVDRFTPKLLHRQQARTTLGLSEDAPILLTICALERHKGVQSVIRALPHVIERFPKLQYLVVGEGPYRPSLEALISELQLASAVRLCGTQPEIIPFLSAANVFLLLSEPNSEALGIAILEAMAMELPVIVTNTPPFDEFVMPEYGILLEDVTPPRVAEAITRLIGQPQDRQIMGKRARSRVVESYSWESAARQYKAAFEHQLYSTSALGVSGDQDIGKIRP